MFPMIKQGKLVLFIPLQYKNSLILRITATDDEMSRRENSATVLHERGAFRSFLKTVQISERSGSVIFLSDRYCAANQSSILTYLLVCFFFFLAVKTTHVLGN